MKNAHSNKLAMYIATLELMNQNNGIWGSVPAIINQVASLGQKIAAIQQQSAIVSANTTGVTEDKRGVRLSLAEQAHLIASALYSYARDIQDNELKQRSTYTISDFRSADDTGIQERAEEMLQLGTQHSAALADYNISQQALNDLQQYLSDFAVKRSAPTLAKSAKKAASIALNTLFRETDDLLKGGLDRSVRTFKLSQPAFFQTYINSRAIIDLGHSSRFIEVEVPPMSHISVHHVVIGSQLRNIGTVAITVIGDHPSNEEGVQLIPGDSMKPRLSRPVITVQNFHGTAAGKIKVRVTSRVPVTNITKAIQVLFNVPAGGSLRINHIVAGAAIENLGPAAITMCDCAQPDCNITDDDQPCGYEQTIESAQRGHAGTTKSYLNATNKDAAQPAQIKVWVFQTGPARPAPEPLA